MSGYGFEGRMTIFDTVIARSWEVEFLCRDTPDYGASSHERRLQDQCNVGWTSPILSHGLMQERLRSCRNDGCFCLKSSIDGRHTGLKDFVAAKRAGKLNIVPMHLRAAAGSRILGHP
jgi:hypothetical protein